MAKTQDLKKTLRESIDAGKAVIGQKRTLTQLGNGMLDTVILASSAPDMVKAEVNRLANLSETKVEQLDIDNIELGLLGKKPFSITMIGLVKA